MAESKKSDKVGTTPAEKKAAADKVAAEKKAAADKVAAEKKAAADKVAAEKKAAADKVATEKAALKAAAEKKAAARVKRAKEVFADHKVEKIYFTSDDSCFVNPQFANMQALSLGDEIVDVVTKKDLK